MNANVFGNPASTPIYVGAGSGGSSGSFPVVGFAAVVGSIIIAFMAVSWVKSERVYGPRTFGIFEKPFVGTPSMVASLRSTNIKDYAPLYKDGTPLMDIFKGCAVKSCIKPDHRAIQSFAKYARNPATYESDVCAMAFLSGNPSYPLSLPAPTWKIDPAQKGDFYQRRCVATNGPVVWDAIGKHQKSVETKAWLVGGAFMIGFWALIAWARRQSAEGEKAK